MPPRRRKKRKSSGDLPKLTFIESPRNIVHKLPSPVFSADHPLTADVVPLSEASLQWVSPQFHGVPASERRTRQRHCSRQNVTTNTSRVTRARKRSGANWEYVSLQFLGQQHPDIGEPLSPVQAAGVQIEQVLNQLDISLPQTAHVVTPNGTPTMEASCHSCTPKHNINPLEASDDLQQNIGRTRPRKSTAAPPKILIGRKRCKMNFDSPSHLGSPQLNNNHLSDISFNGNADETTLRPKAARQRPSSKRLFEKDNKDTVGCDMNENTLFNVCTSPKVTRALHAKTKESLFSGLLHTPKQTYNASNYNVLAYDTPEEDYGLSVHLRRRKILGRRSRLL